MTDFRALCARMADELDHYRQLLTDDRRATHALATEARWFLAQPEPQGPMPTDEELMSLYGVETSCYHGFLAEEFRQELDFARAVLARWGRPANEPVPRS